VVWVAPPDVGRVVPEYNGEMATHQITVHPSKPLDVGSADLVIEISSDDQKLGELRISRGSIDWVPRQHAQARWLAWEQFDALMQEHGRRT
jgi:hypothetical protein